MPGKRIVILGGGFGGAAAARVLRRLLDAKHTVTLVDRQRRTYLCASMVWLLVGERRPQEISRSQGALLQRGVDYVEGEVESIDMANRVVSVAHRTIGFDYLIVATGAEYDWEAVPGAAKAHSFYNLQTARRLRDVLRGFRRGRILIAISRLPYKCPPAPYEAALVLDKAFSVAGHRKGIELHVSTPEPSALRIVGPDNSASFMDGLARRGIAVHTNEVLSQVDPEGNRAVFQSGETIDCDLLITVPVHRSAHIVREAVLTNDAGWVPVDPETLATRHEGVYAIGDATVVPMRNGNPLPKAGVFASAAGELVARNLAAQVQGGATESFEGEGYCFIDQGGGKASMVSGRFLAPDGPVASSRPTDPRYPSHPPQSGGTERRSASSGTGAGGRFSWERRHASSTF